MASDTNQSDSQGWWQTVRMAGKVAAAAGTFCSGGVFGSILGATTGTVILPGVGTAIGLYAGGISGALVGFRVAVYILESDYTPYEKYLNKQGHMPFGIQKVDVGPEGGTIMLQPKGDSRTPFKKEDTIHLEVPKDAVRKQGGGNSKLSIHYGILLNVKFKLEAGYKLVSPVVYISYDRKDTTKLLKLHLPHWASDENVIIVTAPQDNNERGDILNSKEEMVSSSARNAAVSSVSGSHLYAVAVKEGSKSKFYAIPHESPMNNGRGVELSVIISYASSVWWEILREHYFRDGNFPYPCPAFKFLDHSSIRPRLAKDSGPGWDAKLCGYLEIGLNQTDMEFHEIKDGNEVKQAVIDRRYPPRFVCKVNWTEEAEAHGQQKQVGVFIDGSDPKLSFSCMTFEAGPSSILHVSFNVKAKNVIQSFKWSELRKDIEDMLTKPRVDTLERDYNLIDSPCNAKIEAQLTNGDPAAAATTLLKYFEKTHEGDGMLRFCMFLRDEAEKAGGSAVLEDLADRIERAVKDLGASGPS